MTRIKKILSSFCHQEYQLLSLQLQKVSQKFFELLHLHNFYYLSKSLCQFHLDKHLQLLHLFQKVLFVKLVYSLLEQPLPHNKDFQT